MIVDTAWYIAQGVDIHISVWPGMWNCGSAEGELFIYAELQAKYIKVVKSVFDSLGHYARWDLVNLTTPPQPYEPVTGAPVVAAPPADVRWLGFLVEPNSTTKN